MICILPDDEFLEDSGCSEVIVDTLYMWKEKKTGKGGEDRGREGEVEGKEGGNNNGNN